MGFIAGIIYGGTRLSVYFKKEYFETLTILAAFGAIFGSYFIIMLTNWILLTVFADYLPAYQKKYSILTNFVKTCLDCVFL